MMPAQTQKARERWWFGGAAQWAVLLCCVFLILFPKGGFKLGATPITWGYILIGLYALVALPKSLLDPGRLCLKWQVVFLLALLLPFQVAILIELADGIGSVGFVSSILTSFVALPVIFLVMWRSWYTERTLVVLLKIMRWCILLAAVYGVFLFFYRVVTGNLLEIPYLTVNIDDVSDMAGKFIDRGGIFKLISTYNNGNIYGVATLILLPLYDRVERRTSFKLLVRMALLLTLSRTVWAGLIFDRLLTLLHYMLAAFRQYPRIERSTLRRLLGTLIPLGAVVGGILLAYGFASVFGSSINSSFLIDPTLGGRVSDESERGSPLAALSAAKLFEFQQLTGFSEMTYFSVLVNMGLVGFLAILLCFLSPLALALYDRALTENPIRRAALKGMIIYFCVAWVDGAVDYIPVMAFYWIAAVLLVYWPQNRMTAPGQANA
jgi:hypothetical protein